VTRKRFDEHSTEFGLWLREQKEIDSSCGYVATNLDYIWSNYNDGWWILIEEKRYSSKLSYSQKELFKKIHNIALKDDNYKGFYLIVFENTSPDDGNVWINGKPSNRTELINLLKFGILEQKHKEMISHE